jgi:6-pyruvoyltetrahydropterin/6-carboxytetrahydropterin synthase
MPTAYLTRRERFSAAHRLFKPELSDTENIELYGQCSHANWHGHNYELFVTIKGEIDENTGYVVNLKTLGRIIKEEVIVKVDHRNLNVDVDFMQGVVTSTENLAVAIWNCLDQPIRKIGAELYKIRIQETENNYIEYYGEQ